MVMAYRVVLGVQRKHPVRFILPLLLLVTLLLAVWAESRDYYDLLGVSRGATTERYDGLSRSWRHHAP
ncbi:dnaJ homolog subfamily C member 10 [Lates japonicus]|uniref:DnaJ homolog subfamily C member 10 n=1 Tax=Lates japonicus TaxID=270547 RepID=A0AAD3R466_LATJO|nr:dnaJ homolog subfamily C member 10 [Lates japonicus]